MLSSHRQCLAALIAALVLTAPSPGRAGDELRGRIQEIITRPEYKHSRWGILVVDADTGDCLYENRPDELFAPASVTKLYTCAAALLTFGPDYRFRTPVYRRGELADGTLKGDLILVAKGDPTLGGRTDANGRMVFKDLDHTYASFTSTAPAVTDIDPLAGLRALARQVRQSGIRKVDGDVLIDDRLFAASLGTGSGPKIVTPIMVNDNVVDVLLTPGKAVGQRAGVQFRPRNEFIHIDVQVETVAADRKPNITMEMVALARYVLRGEIPLGSPPLVRICPVEPETFARGLFIEALRHEGVAVTASALARPRASLPEKDAYAGLTAVARYESPPLSELIKVILKVSHNLYASTLPLLIAAKHGQRTLAEGMALEKKLLAELGVPVQDISLESGAGGGSGDRVTPRATIALLRAMSARSDFAIYRTAMPSLGVDGTLVNVVAEDSPARGKVWAKSGTFVDDDLLNKRAYLRSKTLAGVMTAKSGRNILFTLFVNDVPLPPGENSIREGKVLARLCEILYEYTPAAGASKPSPKGVAHE